MNSNRVLLAVSLIMAGATGCAYKPRALPVRTVSEYSNAVHHEQVTLAAEAFDATQSNGVLDQPVNKAGVVPVLIVVRNDGSGRSSIDGSRIRLADANGRILDRLPAETAAKKCEKSVAAHAILFGWLSALGAADYNKDMTKDWQEKSFPVESLAIEPHSSKAGLAFYQVDNTAHVHGATVLIPVATGAQEYKEVACVLP